MRGMPTRLHQPTACRRQDYTLVRRAILRSSFHLVVFFDVLEHVVDVRGFLDKVRGVCAIGGTIALTTPNLARGLSEREKWCGFTRNFEHLSYFSADLLRSTLVAMGFEVVHLTSVGRGEPDVSVRLLG